MLLNGKCALITGGNSGICLATARRFVAEGARVAIAGRDAATLAAAANELGVTAIRSDVLDAQARSNLFDRIKDEFGFVGRSLHIQPALTIRPGFPVRVLVTHDLVLEPYTG